MTRCDRFEREGLLQLERGLPLDEHFSTCADCRDARTFYERLHGDIASLGPTTAPAGWQRGVWGRIPTEDALSTRKVARTNRWLYVLAPAMAAAIVAAIFLPQLLREAAQPAIQTEIADAGGQIQRSEIVPGAPVTLGSRLLLHAKTGGGLHAELRVYRNDAELVLQASHTGARSASDEIHATLLLDAVGRYQPVLFISSDTIPSPAGTRDDDYSRARTSGARTILGAEISVR